MDTFFADINTSKRSATHFDIMCAVYLRKYLVKKKGYKLPWKKTSWAKEFAVLRKNLDDNQKMIENVLEWYCAHIGEQYIPEVFSASAFRKKFNQLESHYQKHCAKSTDIKLIPISPLVNSSHNHNHQKYIDSVVTNLSCLGWPKGSLATLQAAIYKTVNSLVVFLEKLQKVLDANPISMKRTPPTFVSFAKFLKSTISYTGTTNMWFHKVHQRISNWDNWHGQLMLEAWDGNLDNKQFQLMMSELSTAHSGSRAAWEDLKGQLLSH